jgi:hypothetical protein
MSEEGNVINLKMEWSFGGAPMPTLEAKFTPSGLEELAKKLGKSSGEGFSFLDLFRSK